MPLWAWLLIGWAVVATGCSMWWARALANADTQDAARRIIEESRIGQESRAVEEFRTDEESQAS